MILKTVRDSAGVRAGIDFKAVRNSVVVEDIVQLARIDSQSVLISNVHRNGAVLLKISNVLVDKDQWRIGYKLRLDFRQRNAILGGQIEIKRRVLQIRRPGSRRSAITRFRSLPARGSIPTTPPGHWLRSCSPLNPCRLDSAAHRASSQQVEGVAQNRRYPVLTEFGTLAASQNKVHS